MTGKAAHLARRHHHTTTDGVERVRRDTGTGGHSPAEQERGQEVTLERADEEDGLDRVVHAEVETTIDDDAEHRGSEATVEPGNAIRRERLSVDVHETVELTLAALLRVLGIVGETRSGIVERVDEEQRRGTGSLYANM